MLCPHYVSFTPSHIRNLSLARRYSFWRAARRENFVGNQYSKWLTRAWGKLLSSVVYEHIYKGLQIFRRETLTLNNFLKTTQRLELSGGKILIFGISKTPNSTLCAHHFYNKASGRVNTCKGENNKKCNQKNILILLFTIIQLSTVWAIAYYIYMYEPFLTFSRIVPFHDTRSNASRSSDEEFMHKSYFSLPGNTMIRVMRGHNLHLIEKLKDLTR